MAYGSLGMHENAQAIVKSSIFPGFDSDQCFHFHWSFNVIRSALKSAKKCIFYYCLVSIISLGFFKFSIALFSDSFTRALCTLICFISFLLLLFTIYKHDFFSKNWWLNVTSQKKVILLLSIKKVSISDGFFEVWHMIW